MSESVLSARHVCKTYRLGRVRVPVLKGVNIDIASSSWTAVLGASGSGKSTLLHLLGGLDRPDRKDQNETPPSITYRGLDLASMNSAALDRYRSETVGFVFQFYHLLPELSVLENVTIGAMVRYGRFGYIKARAETRDRARELLTAFGLSHRLKHRPRELSGGERQRVAIARALINRPQVLLADEPTGNLDRATGGAILDTIESLQRSEGLTMVMVTHDPTIASRADRIVHLEDGVVIENAKV